MTSMSCLPAGFSGGKPLRVGSDTPGATSARRIEPAEPEPPPAHSLGRVDEDIMGRSGQLVRPRQLGESRGAFGNQTRHGHRGHMGDRS